MYTYALLRYEHFSSRINRIILIILGIALSITILNLMVCPTFAADSASDVVETTFFGNIDDDGSGCGIYTVINLIVDIMSIGIGILGVIGIMITGIQYLTAGGNETQTQKAKRRFGEIVIGLIAFVALYTATQWLLPGAKLNNTLKCNTVSDEELAKLKEEAKAKQEQNKNNSTPNSNSPTTNNHNSIPKTTPYLKISKFNRECLTNNRYNTTGEKIVCILNKISIWADENNVHYGDKTWKGNNSVMNCATFTTAAYIEAGLLKKGDYFALQGNSVQNWDAVKKRGTLVKTDVPDGTTVKTLVKQGKLLPGDTIGLKSSHTYMYIGKNSNGKYKCQQLGRGQTISGNGSHQHSRSKFTCGNNSVYVIVHPKRSIKL